MNLFVKDCNYKISKARLVIALLLSPLLGLATILGPYVLIIPLVLVFAGPIIYISEIAFGLPILLLLRFKCLFSLNYYLTAGFICASPMAIYHISARANVWTMFPNSNPSADIEFLIKILFIGIASGFWFWVIGIMGGSPNDTLQRTSR